VWKKKSVIVLCTFCMLVGAGSFYLGYRYLEITHNIQKPISGQSVSQHVSDHKSDKSQELQSMVAGIQQEITVSSTPISKITPSTKLVYEYYYEADNQLVTEEEEPPYFLLNMTRNDLQSKFPDWQIQSFSSQEVIVRTYVKGQSPNRYRIGIHNGYVAIFYENPVEGIYLKDVTETPVASLSQEEQEELAGGVVVLGDDELLLLLEDYTS
jgi:hypothetical protein